MVSISVGSRGRGGMWRGRASVVLQFVGREVTVVELPLSGRDVSVSVHDWRGGGRSIGRWAGVGGLVLVGERASVRLGGRWGRR